jgi:hypothetical protein
MSQTTQVPVPSESFSAIWRHTRPPGVILVASLPPEGAIGLTLKFARKHPLQFEIVNTLNLTREYFFSASLPDDRVAAYASRLGDESYRVFLDMLA